MMKKKILVIDSDRMVTDFLNELLTAESHEVIVAKTSQEAVKRASEEDFDLIVLDVDMPYMGYINLYSKINEVNKNKFVPIVLISGSGLEPSLLQAIKGGADTYLLKPSP